MVIDRPIFLLGPGRSGSTLLNNLLTHHRDVGYFTAWSNRFPRLWMLAAGHRLRSWRLEKSGRRIRFYPGPTEAYRIWKHCFPDFWRQCRGPCRDAAGAERARRLIERHLRVQGKTRFVAKLTGPPMFTFFRSIFPDARFVWIDRDPRAVVYSFSRREKVWAPPELPEHEARSVKLRQAAERYLSIYRELGACDTGEYRLLLYRDLVEDPVPEMERLVRDLELRQDPRLLQITGRWSIRDANRKWRRDLDAGHHRLLDRLLAEPLGDRGLSPDGVDT